MNGPFASPSTVTSYCSLQREKKNREGINEVIKEERERAAWGAESLAAHH